MIFSNDDTVLDVSRKRICKYANLKAIKAFFIRVSEYLVSVVFVVSNHILQP